MLIGVKTELLMRHVWGDGVTSSSNACLPAEPLLSELVWLSLSPMLPLNNVKREREVRVKCQCARSLISSMLLDARKESMSNRRQRQDAQFLL